MAAEYARREGVPDAVATAVEEHYLPEGPDSPLPASEAGALLAAAEKVDNLVGAFAVDEAPTGSKDPYGLRRAATGLVRIAARPRLGRRPVRRSSMAAHERLAAQGADLWCPTRRTPSPRSDAFLSDRLVYLLGAEGVGAEAAAAAMARGPRRRWPRPRPGRGRSRRARGTPRFEARLDRPHPPRRASRARAPGEDDAGRRRATTRARRALREAIAAARRRIDAARAARDFAAGAGRRRAAGRRRSTGSSWTCW